VCPEEPDHDNPASVVNQTDHSIVISLDVTLESGSPLDLIFAGGSGGHLITPVAQGSALAKTRLDEQRESIEEIPRVRVLSQAPSH
jgi:hypothetical protein